jgi:cell division inhibitor SepF
MHYKKPEDSKTIFDDFELVNAKIYEYENSSEVLEANNIISDVMIFEPHTFPEMPKIVESIGEHDVTILSMENMKEDESQRAIDFLSGGILAFDMKIELLDKKYYLITPDKTYISPIATHPGKCYPSLRKNAHLVPVQTKLSHTYFQAS